MSVEIKIPDIQGVTLHTKNKYVADDINISITIPQYQYETDRELEFEIDNFLQGTITKYSNHRITELKTYGFTSSQITELDLPNLKKIISYGIMTTSIEKLHLPSIEYIGSNGIYQNSKLKEARFDNCSMFGSGAIRGSVVLVKLIMGYTEKPCVVQASNAFAECYHLSGTVHATHNPEGLQDGLIYVPDHLVEDYKVATNWSTFADQIRPMSELEEE